MKKKIICIVGPTASGKTKLAVELAKKFGGEIISADSRQVYKGLDIGAGKDLSEYGKVPYHLIDICEPEEKFTLFNWLKEAREKIDALHSQNILPIVVGGTGLYTQALVEGFQLAPANFKLQNPNFKSISNDKCPNFKTKIYTRKELEKKSLKQLREIYNRLPATDNKLDLNNPHRLIRAIEKAQTNILPTKKKPNFEALQIGIKMPREKLYERIDKRVDQRFEKEGMLEEVADLIDREVDINWLTKLGLEYRIVGIYVMSQRLGLKNLKIKKLIENSKFKIDNFNSFESMATLLKYKSHAFSRRQLTWYRRFPAIVWVTSEKEAFAAVDNYLKM
jgi:tRNA dimethylallyltransferase